MTKPSSSYIRKVSNNFIKIRPEIELVKPPDHGSIGSTMVEPDHK